MHFPIIAIENMETPRKDWVTELNQDDAVLCENTDYFGEMYSTKERLEVIRSEWFKQLFRDYAVIDANKGTITFFDPDTCWCRFKNYLKRITKKLNDDANNDKLTGYEFRRAGMDYEDYSTLFYKDGYGYTSFMFLEDAHYYGSRTFRIGNIFDAHF